MSRFVVAFLILSGILMLQTSADGSEAINVHEVSKKMERATSSSIADPPAEVISAKEKTTDAVAEAPVVRKISRHHSTDKSEAGGGVIIGGLVTVVFAAVYCYLRVTRRRSDGEKH